MSKKSWADPGKVWLEALCDFENELHEHVEKAGKDQLRLQDGRLFKSLIKNIKAKATGKDEWVAMFDCYQFVTNTSWHLGYDEARRLHGEEMKARGLSSARSFCSFLPKQFAQAPEQLQDLLVIELRFRVRSVASWMEAQTSFSFWLGFKDLRQAWRGNIDERARAIQALYLSKLPQKCLIKTKHRDRELISACFPEGVRIGTNYKNKPWSNYQWKDILEHAAGLTDKRCDCTELERWVWWCFPVFRRYRWNTREVLNAASIREIAFENEKAGIDKLINFQKYWIRRGLRFVGRKQKQNRTPPLAEFVRRLVLPDSTKMWGSLAGFLFLPKNN